MVIKKFILRIILLLNFIFIPLAFAQLSAENNSPDKPLVLSPEETQWIANNPTIIVGGERDWAPFDFVDSQGNYIGICHDYLQELEKLTGLNFEVKLGKWAELIELTKSKKIDLLPALMWNKERATHLEYTKPYMNSDNYIFVKDSNKTIKNLQDLKGKRVAITKGYAVINYLKEHHPDIIIHETNQFTTDLFYF